MKQVSELLLNLFTDTQNPFRKNFLENIRQYNSALALASIRVNMEVMKPGIFVYKIHGAAYFNTSSLHPSEESGPRSYCQLYVVDSDQANQERLGRTENANCDHRVMKDLDAMLRSSNKLAQRFLTVAELEKKEQENCREPVLLKMMFAKTPGNDLKVYREPTSSEVAIVFTGPDGGAPDKIDFTVCNRDGHLQTLGHCSPHCDPMCYPLLFPNGEYGWDPYMKHDSSFATRTRDRLTMLQFFQHRLAVREGFSTIHSAQKLFQQYIVTSYTR